jgi:hypothetical protein
MLQESMGGSGTSGCHSCLIRPASRNGFSLWVTTPDRAASTVGDLLEEPARGIWWFWSGVCRTTLSLLWHDIAADSAHLLGLGVRGFILNTMLVVVSILGFTLTSGLIVGDERNGTSYSAE